jgi:hypothetical protein
LSVPVTGEALLLIAYKSDDRVSKDRSVPAIAFVRR